MTLPTTKQTPQTDPSRLTICLYGDNGIGKTTWVASTGDGTLFLATEPGQAAVEGYVLPIKTWEDFATACAEIKAGGHPFTTIAVDTITNLYRMACDFHCRQAGTDHISKIPGFQRGHDLVNTSMYNYLRGLAQLPYGLILVAHTKEKTIKPDNGAEYIRMVADLPDGIRKRVLGLCDLVLYLTMQRMDPAGDGEGATYRRVIRTQPSWYCEARDRFNVLPDPTVMPLNPADNYREFLKYFSASNRRPGAQSISHNTTATAAMNAKTTTAAAAAAAAAATSPTKNDKNTAKTQS